MKKTLVVTGGSKGIGKSVVLKFAQNGYAICTTARQEKGLALLQQEIKSKYPECEFFYKATDQSKKNEVEQFARFCVQTLGTIDVLVANAGTYLPGQIHSEPDGTLETLIAQNVYSSYYLIRNLLQVMIKKQSGHIFTICSTASITPYVNGGSYCISKYALLGLTKVLREEMKVHHVKVTAVLPGATRTDSWDGTPLPDSRFMKPEDVADMIYSCCVLSEQAVVEEILMRPIYGDISE